jgi:RecA-family ATPase
LSKRPVPIIDTLFPGQRVHLIGGASGSGKTTWLMQIIELWRRGEAIYGYLSHPVPFIYLSYDRDTDDFEDTCERLKIDPKSYTFISPTGLAFDTPLLQYLEALNQQHPEAKLYIIEGIASQTPEGKINDQRIVGRWLRMLQTFCKKKGVTIIGVLHSAKTKERDRYREPRARIAGCGAWAGYSSTVVIIEEKEADTESEIRELMILPRNAGKHVYSLDFKDGLLVEIPKAAARIPKFEQWLCTIQPGEIFNVGQIRVATGLSDSRIFLELERAQNLKKIEKVSSGTYCKLSDLPN